MISEFFGYDASGNLRGEKVCLSDVARAFGTPVYVYSQTAIESSYDRLGSAFAALSPDICFSIKSCHNLHVLRVLQARGSGFDAVSGWEVRRAVEAGADPATIVFAGVGKTDDEMLTTISLGVGRFNIESVQELQNLSEFAALADRDVAAAVRINPDVDALTHPHTTTGRNDNKFGVDVETARELFLNNDSDSRVRLCGLHVHIGSPVNTVEPYVKTVRAVLGLIGELSERGVTVSELNLGGGWGVSYQAHEVPMIEDYADAIVPLLADRGLCISLEPGRFIVANAGVLVARVLYVKQGRAQRFVITDAGMTDLIRPALYDAEHFIWPVAPRGGLVPQAWRCDAQPAGTAPVDIVGPVCESGDFLGKSRWLPPVERGDLLAVFSAGAYGAVMSSQYNSRPRAGEMLIRGDSTRLIRRRETYDDLVRAEREVSP